jgi:hypothetical protein
VGYVVSQPPGPVEPNLRLLAGTSLAALVHAALAPLPAAPSYVLATPDPKTARAEDSLARIAATELRRRDHAARIVAPPPSAAAAWMRVRSTQWVPVELGSRASRPETVWIASPLASGEPVIAVNQLDSRQPDRDPVAIAVWARFAHPRQRTGALVSDDRDGPTAEIALAVKPAVILLAGTWRGASLLIAATDQIAAELAGRAFLDLVAPEDGIEPVGPWEHPLVQRATELHLGVRLPSEILAECVWLGDPASAERSAFLAFSTELLGRIGVLATG